jgi:hypothetical protein
MSVLGNTVLCDHRKTVAMIGRLRLLAQDCLENAARAEAAGVAETLRTMSRDYEEEARRLETKLIISRAIG